MKRMFSNGRYANVTATLALIVALGGTSYAAVVLPRNSVGSGMSTGHTSWQRPFMARVRRRRPSSPDGGTGDVKVSLISPSVTRSQKQTTRP